MKKTKVVESHPTLCDPVDYIEFYRPLPFSRGSSQPWVQTQVSLIAGGCFTSWATREAQEYWSGQPIASPGDLPNPGVKLGSLGLQADSLPTELSGKPRCFGNLDLCYRPQRLMYLVLMPTPCSSWRSAYLVRFLPPVCCHAGGEQRKLLCLSYLS